MGNAAGAPRRHRRCRSFPAGASAGGGDLRRDRRPGAAGWLDERPHTSNAASYLKGTGYGGAAHYRDEPAVRAQGLITAGGMAPLEFAREILVQLGLYDDEVLEAWYQLYKTGKSEHFARMARSAQAAEPAAAAKARGLPAQQGGPRDGRAGKEATMRNSNRPSGPGKPMKEVRDSVVAREELDEIEEAASAGNARRDPVRDARHAERAAHAKEQGHTKEGTSGNRRRG